MQKLGVHVSGIHAKNIVDAEFAEDSQPATQTAADIDDRLRPHQFQDVGYTSCAERCDPAWLATNQRGVWGVEVTRSEPGCSGSTVSRGVCIFNRAISCRLASG